MSKENAFVLQEQNILSLCVNYPELIHEVDGMYLISKAAQGIYKSLETLIENNVSITPRNIYTEVQKEVDVQEEVVQNLFDLQVTKEDFKGLYTSLKSQWAGNNIQNFLLEDLLENVSKKGEPDFEKIQELRNTLDENIALIDQSNLRKKIFSLKEMFDFYEEELNKRESGNFFYDTGCSYLNRNLTIGFAPQFITMIFGQSGVGKSTYALYLINKQINKQIPSINFSLEMPLIVNIDRLVAQRLRIPLSLLYPSKGEGDEEIGLNEEIRSRVEKERQKLSHLKYFKFVDEESLLISDMERIIKKTKKEMGVD